MKLSKTAQFIFGIGILVIALISLLVVYRQERQKIEHLDSALPLAQATLPKMVSEKDSVQGQLMAMESQLSQLDGELAEATSALNTAKASFPEHVETIEFGEALFKYATDWKLLVSKLSSTGPQTVEDEDIEFSITIVEVEVNGDVDDILNFVDAIAGAQDFTPATIELVEIKASDAEEGPSALIQLIIYGYRGE